MNIADFSFPTPYYAVIFTSIKREETKGYGRMSERMIQIAGQQKGFLGIESAREEIGVTISYWKSLDAIQSWQQNVRHLYAQEMGRSEWYKEYRVRICKVEREYGFENL